MTHQVTDRELLAELIARPIGSPELAAEADAKRELGRGSASAELRETIDRTHKKWLPAGKRSSLEANRRALADAMERQTDLEDAVVAAGGEKGGLRT